MSWIIRLCRHLSRAALHQAREQAVLAQLDAIEAAMWQGQVTEWRREQNR
jgi:hypothetical protein